MGVAAVAFMCSVRYARQGTVQVRYDSASRVASFHYDSRALQLQVGYGYGAGASTYIKYASDDVSCVLDYDPLGFALNSTHTPWQSKVNIQVQQSLIKANFSRGHHELMLTYDRHLHVVDFVYC